ncbi:uncharacterized protein LOC133901469 isoform X2 [Phragmites australis]|uniref:uncharacterized protein LOC133901469 isoform X2 n=1 Tax=Phragmites australis TaxID=29695 RepID=UPI002D76F23D|nr:uncharacterized protein LOC133901469 isoform X2 [Phragmites australis]
MGSEGPPAVTIHVTGFKKFYGVAENPTEKIMSNLQSFMEKRGLPNNLILGSCTVLEAAGEGALGTLYKVLESAIADIEKGSSVQGQVIWVHFGLSSGLTRFALENQAVNEATFACPDELGWKPQRIPIVPSDGSISRTRKTTLPVNELGKTLRKIGHDVMRSDDADKFVCNYVYYHSLRFAEQHGIKSMFVHVPLFSTIDEEVQMHFVASLLEVLACMN